MFASVLLTEAPRSKLSTPHYYIASCNWTHALGFRNSDSLATRSELHQVYSSPVSLGPFSALLLRCGVRSRNLINVVARVGMHLLVPSSATYEYEEYLGKLGRRDNHRPRYHTQ